MSDDYYAFDNESLLKSRSGTNIQRQGSLIRPERNRFDNPNHPHHYYSKKTRHSHTGANGTCSGPEDIAMEDLSTDSKKPNVAGKPMPSKTPQKQRVQNETLSLWEFYCYLITFWAPNPLLKLAGMEKQERQMAWREKIALISVVIYASIFIAYLTFGFSRTVCHPGKLRLRNNHISNGYVIINGQAFDLELSSHPAAAGIPAGANVLLPPVDAGGRDASFLFQNVNGNCKGLIKPRDNCTIPHDADGNLAWYFPCKLFNQDGSSRPDFTKSKYYSGWSCHTAESARKAYYSLDVAADVYFTWDDIKNSTRNLVVYNGNVLDMDLLDWLEYDDLTWPNMFESLKTANLQGYDISLILTNEDQRHVARCLSEIIKVGTIDSDTIGCIASHVVLYVALTFILSVVAAKFLIACYFHWCVAKKQGAYIVDNKTMNKRANDIEDWSENITTQGPMKTVSPNLRAHHNPMKRGPKFSTSNENMNFHEDRDKVVERLKNCGMTTMTTQYVMKSCLSSDSSKANKKHSRSGSTLTNPFLDESLISKHIETLDPTIIHPDAVTQPPLDYMPFGYPLVHTICVVTCYSEDECGLRATLDSVSTTDYPNSHKLIMVLCDGLVKGSGNDLTTPEIVLGMMENFVVPLDEVKPYSYVAVASGSKRHNMAKIYAGFYKYDNSLVPPEKQQRVPMITIVKCGTPEEQGSAKPGNRGKRDSQVILMSFLQKITFDERMTDLEYQLLRNIWQITGLMADFYETVLMVDADTKVFPDALTHMVAEMVKDPEIMALCGETKIANKKQSWVTAIQVFEYYISHHQAKAFESVFGSVTCLPGCFSIYRIKCPKGKDGYWVPILANPDIVERYSDNCTTTVHKKNLLLLGEDRFLSSLMLKTFPKRKQVFVAKAACKTIAPDKFKVLLSQRRRWINSTIHNLMELVLINDLCGTFCFSMQFVIGIELIGTMVLPVAICFTIYVIVFSIVSKPVPILSLVLLAIILGLPGLIIIVTATRVSYLIWLVIYLLALPIWNLVLPTYAYWKFDDFSWGDTRQVTGGNKSGHDEDDGEFDHSNIKMKTWREFERDSRLEKMNHMPFDSDDLPLSSASRTNAMSKRGNESSREPTFLA